MIASLDDGVACQRCWDEAENTRLNFDYCEKCDASLPRLQLRSQARRCGQCEELAFAAARAGGVYKGAIREAVLSLKMQPHLPAQLVRLLCETFWQLPQASEISAILPVPLHHSRVQERGFNQAEVIANHLAGKLGLPVYPTAVRRQIVTERHRAGMDAQARLKSLADAFAVTAPRLIADQTLLLVDDVMTTGSTAHELTVTLLNSGARAVNVLTVARAITQFNS